MRITKRQGRSKSPSEISGIPLWDRPRAKFLGLPVVLIHAGLGPRDSIGHQTPRSPAHTLAMQMIARNIQTEMIAKTATKRSSENLVLKGISELEKFPLFNAGLGAKLQRDGMARLSASMMRGSDQRFASVSNVEGFVHPSKIVHRLLDEKDRNLSGSFASAYALEMGLDFLSPVTVEREKEWEESVAGSTGTVGCIAIDKLGSSFAATSTGGRGFERPGRVSDSCSPAGNYANKLGAVSCTGVGEEILEDSVASSILTRMDDGLTLEESVTRCFENRNDRKYGVICADSEGNALIHATKGTLLFAVITPHKIWTGITAEDWFR